MSKQETYAWAFERGKCDAIEGRRYVWLRTDAQRAGYEAGWNAGRLMNAARDWVLKANAR